jgi:hypothetical protein
MMDVREFVRWHLRLSLIEPSVDEVLPLVFGLISNVVLDLDLCSVKVVCQGVEHTWRFRDVHSAGLVYLLVDSNRRLVKPLGSVLREFSRSEGDVQYETISACGQLDGGMHVQPFRPGERLTARTYYWFPVGVWTNKIGISEHLSFAFISPDEDSQKLDRLASGLRGRSARVVGQSASEFSDGVPSRRLAISSYVGRGELSHAKAE